MSISICKEGLYYLCTQGNYREGCLTYLVRVCDTRTDTPSIESVRIFSEFSDVIFIGIPGLSTYRHIDFVINI